MTPQAEQEIVLQLKRIAVALEKLANTNGELANIVQEMYVTRKTMERLIVGGPPALHTPEEAPPGRVDDLPFTAPAVAPTPATPRESDLDLVLRVNSALMAGGLRVNGSGVVELAL